MKLIMTGELNGEVQHIFEREVASRYGEKTALSYARNSIRKNLFKVDPLFEMTWTIKVVR